MTLDAGTCSIIVKILTDLPGVVSAAVLTDAQKERAVELESRHDAASVIPIRNVGVALIARRDACFVLLKGGGFRPPAIPTVYLVEKGAAEGATNAITVEGQRYAVVGEEVVPSRTPYAEPTIPLDESFVIFPQRRSGVGVPCSFILPPIAFPELEARAESLGIADVISISPSLAADSWLREAFGFPPTNSLATLLVACNPRGAQP